MTWTSNTIFLRAWSWPEETRHNLTITPHSRPLPVAPRRNQHPLHSLPRHPASSPLLDTTRHEHRELALRVPDDGCISGGGGPLMTSQNILGDPWPLPLNSTSQFTSVSEARATDCIREQHLSFQLFLRESASLTKTPITCLVYISMSVNIYSLIKIQHGIKLVRNGTTNYGSNLCMIFFIGILMND